MRRFSREGLVLLALAIAGCGSGDGSPAAGDGGVTPSASGLSWLENGKQHSALFASAARVTSTMTDMVQVTGGEAGGIGISFGLTMPPPLLPGSYPCGVSGNRIIVSFSYADAGLYQSCNVTLSSIGAKTGDRAAGTFSAAFPATGGGARMITSGVFNVPLTVSSL